MTDKLRDQEAAPILADQVNYLIATAARAPSVHNTQPWRFKLSPDAIELYADPGRKLRIDRAGREMLISCGAALFGLRLAIRSLGYQPVTELLPDPAQQRLLARVRLGAAVPISAAERRMLEAIPHRHTHRGPFANGPLPDGLLPALQHDAMAEGSTLVLVQRALSYQQLTDVVNAVGRRQDLDPVARAEMRRWTRAIGTAARDGVPAHAFEAQAFPAAAGRPQTRLRQRDFDLGRGAWPAHGGRATRRGHRGTGHPGRSPRRLAACRAGTAPAAGPRRHQMGVCQPALTALGGCRDPVRNPRPAETARGTADAAPVRPGPGHPGHRPPTACRTHGAISHFAGNVTLAVAGNSAWPSRGQRCCSHSVTAALDDGLGADSTGMVAGRRDPDGGGPWARDRGCHPGPGHASLRPVRSRYSQSMTVVVAPWSWRRASPARSWSSAAVLVGSSAMPR